MPDGRRLSNHQRHHILKRGEPATANVVSVVNTGQPASFEVDLDVELDVRPDGAPPFHAWARIERLFDTCAEVLTPGTAVLVRFDKSDGATVIDRENIDFLHPDIDVGAAAARAILQQRRQEDLAAFTASLGQSAPRVAPVPLRSLTLAEPARHGTARIHAVRKIGDAGLMTVYHLHVAVQPADGSPAFSATVFARRTAAQADSLREGGEVDVVYDVTNPYAVMLGP
jgi:hypothetical protein